MHPLVRALLSSWEWRLDVLAVLVPLGLLYTIGWLRLRARSTQDRFAAKNRLVAYASGWVLVVTALMSPLDRLGDQLFFVHMIQHMLLTMFAAPLFLLGNPFPMVLWGLPEGWRQRIASLFTRDSRFRRILALATRPIVAFALYVIMLVGWHDPVLYSLAQGRSWIHDLEHVSFFGSALLYWWHIIGAGPRLHGRFPILARMAYLLGIIPFNMITGVSIAFAQEPVFPHYLTVPRIWGFTLMQDQMLGGAIMWIQGSEMQIVIAVIVLGLSFRKRKRTPPGELLDGEENPGATPNKWRELALARTQTRST
jgi:cytochrome c oxidase assembly factor CtaG